VPRDADLRRLGSSRTLQDGSEIQLSNLAGSVQVLAMVYTHCEHACPRIIADMHRIRSQLKESKGRVDYLLVSLDPERDDVERLAHFAKTSRLGQDWTLLRAADRTVRELAAALGIRYRRVSKEEFIRSSVISVLDAYPPTLQGKLSFVFPGQSSRNSRPSNFPELRQVLM